MSGELDDRALPIPDSFVCCISQEVMVDPVSTCDGHTYEKAAILHWLQRNNTSPLTNLPLFSRQLTPNIALKSAIQTWRSLRPDVIVTENKDFELAVKLHEEELNSKMASSSCNTQRLEAEVKELWRVINAAGLGSTVNRDSFQNIQALMVAPALTQATPLGEISPDTMEYNRRVFEERNHIQEEEEVDQGPPAWMYENPHALRRWRLQHEADAAPAQRDRSHSSDARRDPTVGSYVSAASAGSYSDRLSLFDSSSSDSYYNTRRRTPHRRRSYRGSRSPASRQRRRDARVESRDRRHWRRRNDYETPPRFPPPPEPTQAPGDQRRRRRDEQPEAPGWGEASGRGQTSGWGQASGWGEARGLGRGWG